MYKTKCQEKTLAVHHQAILAFVHQESIIIKIFY